LTKSEHFDTKYGMKKKGNDMKQICLKYKNLINSWSWWWETETDEVPLLVA